MMVVVAAPTTTSSLDPGREVRHDIDIANNHFGDDDDDEEEEGEVIEPPPPPAASGARARETTATTTPRTTAAASPPASSPMMRRPVSSNYHQKLSPRSAAVAAARLPRNNSHFYDACAPQSQLRGHHPKFTPPPPVLSKSSSDTRCDDASIRHSGYKRTMIHSQLPIHNSNNNNREHKNNEQQCRGEFTKNDITASLTTSSSAATAVPSSPPSSSSSSVMFPPLPLSREEEQPPDMKRRRITIGNGATHHIMGGRFQPPPPTHYNSINTATATGPTALATTITPRPADVKTMSTSTTTLLSSATTATQASIPTNTTPTAATYLEAGNNHAATLNANPVGYQQRMGSGSNNTSMDKQSECDREQAIKVGGERQIQQNYSSRINVKNNHTDRPFIFSSTSPQSRGRQQLQQCGGGVGGGGREGGQLLLRGSHIGINSSNIPAEQQSMAWQPSPESAVVRGGGGGEMLSGRREYARLADTLPPIILGGGGAGGKRHSSFPVFPVTGHGLGINSKDIDGRNYFPKQHLPTFEKGCGGSSTVNFARNNIGNDIATLPPRCIGGAAGSIGEERHAANYSKNGRNNNGINTNEQGNVPGPRQYSPPPPPPQQHRQHHSQHDEIPKFHSPSRGNGQDDEQHSATFPDEIRNHEEPRSPVVVNHISVGEENGNPAMFSLSRQDTAPFIQSNIRQPQMQDQQSTTMSQTANEREGIIVSNGEDAKTTTSLHRPRSVEKFAVFHPPNKSTTIQHSPKLGGSSKSPICPALPYSSGGGVIAPREPNRLDQSFTDMTKFGRDEGSSSDRTLMNNSTGRDESVNVKEGQPPNIVRKNSIRIKIPKVASEIITSPVSVDSPTQRKIKLRISCSPRDVVASGMESPNGKDSSIVQKNAVTVIDNHSTSSLEKKSDSDITSRAQQILAMARLRLKMASRKDEVVNAPSTLIEQVPAPVTHVPTSELATTDTDAEVEPPPSQHHPAVLSESPVSLPCDNLVGHGSTPSALLNFNQMRGTVKPKVARIDARYFIPTSKLLPMSSSPSGNSKRAIVSQSSTNTQLTSSLPAKDCASNRFNSHKQTINMECKTASIKRLSVNMPKKSAQTSNMPVTQIKQHRKQVSDLDHSESDTDSSDSESSVSTSSSSSTSSASSSSSSSSSTSSSTASSRSSSSTSSSSSSDSDSSSDDDSITYFTSTARNLKQRGRKKNATKERPYRRKSSCVPFVVPPPPPKEFAPTEAELRKILREDSATFGECNCNNWVRRSSRQPSKSVLNSAGIRDLLDKLKSNDSDMVVLKMKKYINDPDVSPVIMDAALDALEENMNCQALYIQNFNNAMRDNQMMHLLRILQSPTCRIWCINIGETYNVAHKTWKKFAQGLRHTNVTHMYASEHTITPAIKERFRDVIRDNRVKHSMHVDPNNLEVIIRCTHCWWNPINAKSLQPYIKNSGYEHILFDKASLGLKGTTDGNNIDTI